MSKEREQLIARSKELRIEDNEIDKRLKEINYKIKYDSAFAYVGKYYVRDWKDESTMPDYVFVYGVSSGCYLLALCVQNSEEKDSQHVSITHEDLFDLDDSLHHLRGYDGCDPFDKWKECTKEEFMNQYEEVSKKINDIVLKT